MQMNMHEAKSQLSKLVELAAQGEDIILAKAGKPVARLVPYENRPKRQFGQYKGQFKIAEDFDSEETKQTIADLFEGK